MFDDPRLPALPDPLHVCPRCGKQAMKEVEQNHFHCLWCRFDRRIDRFDGDSLMAVIVVVIGIIFLASIFSS